MSGLVERVKGAVRNKSRHRHSESTDSTGPRNSSDQYVLAPETSHGRSSMQDSRKARDSGTSGGIEGTTRGFQALNMNDSDHSTLPGHAAPTKTLPPLPTNAARNIETARAQNDVTNGTSHKDRPISGYGSSSSSPIHRRNISGTNAAVDNQASSPESTTNRRDSVLRRKPLASTKTDTSPNVLDNAEYSGLSSPTRGHMSGRNVDVAPNDQSPLVPHFTTRSAASPTSNTFASGDESAGAGTAQHSRDLRVPANFDLNNTEQTHVETTVVPAVTQEEIHIQRTEIITKAVHRDIHIDHHYTYVQPIPVLEILPARHFHLDPVTGTKTEIAAPAGYKLPAHLQPRRAEDYSHLRQTTRHYVVDDDHPHGQLESAPVRHKHDRSDLNGQRNGFANGISST